MEGLEALGQSFPSVLPSQGLPQDAFQALLAKEWKDLSPSAQQLGWQLLVEPLPVELKGDLAPVLRPVAFLSPRTPRLLG